MFEKRGHEYCQKIRDHFYEVLDRLMESGRVGGVSCIELFAISQ